MKILFGLEDLDVKPVIVLHGDEASETERTEDGDHTSSMSLTFRLRSLYF